MVVCCCLGVVVYCPHCHQIVFACCVVLELVHYEPGHETFPVVFQSYPVVEFYLSAKNACKLSSQGLLLTDILLNLKRIFNKFLRKFAIAFVLYIFLPNSLVFVQLSLQPRFLIVQFLLHHNLIFIVLYQIQFPLLSHLLLPVVLLLPPMVFLLET